MGFHRSGSARLGFQKGDLRARELAGISWPSKVANARISPPQSIGGSAGLSLIVNYLVSRALT